jgi:hypothetical protein
MATAVKPICLTFRVLLVLTLVLAVVSAYGAALTESFLTFQTHSGLGSRSDLWVGAFIEYQAETPATSTRISRIGSRAQFLARVFIGVFFVQGWLQIMRVFPLPGGGAFFCQGKNKAILLRLRI